MGSRFRRNFGLSPRSARSASQVAVVPLALAAPEEMMLAPGPHPSRIFFWAAMLATIAAGVVYLCLVR